MSYKPVITMTLAYRADYTRRVLDHLAACRGIDKYLLLPTVEPVSDEVVKLAEGIDFCRTSLEVNSQRLGCDANTRYALERGFQHSDYVIHIEDDILLTFDALEFFEYCRSYQHDPQVFTVTAYNRLAQDVVGDRYHTLERRQWFHPWGWATWKDRFAEMRPRWRFFEPVFDKKLGRLRGSGWDRRVSEIRGDRCEVYPVLSRSQNIGAENGENVRPEQHVSDQIYLKFWGGEIEIPTGRWHEKRT